MKDSKGNEIITEKGLKRLDVRVTLDGHGVVNYDGNEQKYFLSEHCGHMLDGNNNYKYCKKFYTKRKEEDIKTFVYETSDGKTKTKTIDMDYGLKISSNCIKKEIFGDAWKIDQVTWKYPETAVPALASPLVHMRGYTNVDPIAGFNRNTCIIVGDAIDDKAVIKREVYTHTGVRNDTSLFYKDSVDDTHYVVEMCFDVERAQIMYADDTYNRIGINPNYIEGANPYGELLRKKYGHIPYKQGVYIKKGADEDSGDIIGEESLVYDDEFLNMLLHTFLKQVFRLNIRRSDAYARTVKVEIRPIYDPVRDCDNDFVEIAIDDVDSLNFKMHQFYECVADNEMRKEWVKAKTESKRTKADKEREKKEKKKGNDNDVKEKEE